MPVERESSLRSQLEQMQLCSQNLLASCHRGQIKPELHLLTSHCKENRTIRDHKKTHLLVELLQKPAANACMQKSHLTFVKETAHSIPLQKVRVLCHSIHICNRVVQVKHVLRWLLVSMDCRGVLHPKNLQKSLDGSGPDLLWLVLRGEVILQVVERRPRSDRAQ